MSDKIAECEDIIEEQLTAIKQYKKEIQELKRMIKSRENIILCERQNITKYITEELKNASKSIVSIRIHSMLVDPEYDHTYDYAYNGKSTRMFNVTYFYAAGKLAMYQLMFDLIFPAGGHTLGIPMIGGEKFPIKIGVEKIGEISYINRCGYVNFTYGGTEWSFKFKECTKNSDAKCNIVVEEKDICPT